MDAASKRLSNSTKIVWDDLIIEGGEEKIQKLIKDKRVYGVVSSLSSEQLGLVLEVCAEDSSLYNSQNPGHKEELKKLKDLVEWNLVSISPLSNEEKDLAHGVLLDKSVESLPLCKKVYEEFTQLTVKLVSGQE